MGLGTYIGNRIGHHSGSKASAYDVGAEALFARMTALGETPTDTRKTIINDLFVAGKAKSFWNKLDVCYLLAAHGTLSSRLNILENDHNITLVGATPAFTTDKGWVGGSATVYLEADYNPTNDAVHYSQDSATLGIYSQGNTKNNTTMDIIGTLSYLQYAVDGTVYSALNSTQYHFKALADIAGLLTTVRKDSVTLNLYKGITSQGEMLRGSSSVPNGNLFLCRTQNQHSLAFLGSAFTTQDIADFSTVFVDGYLNSIGAKV